MGRRAYARIHDARIHSDLGNLGRSFLRLRVHAAGSLLSSFMSGVSLTNEYIDLDLQIAKHLKLIPDNYSSLTPEVQKLIIENLKGQQIVISSRAREFDIHKFERNKKILQIKEARKQAVAKAAPKKAA